MPPEPLLVAKSKRGRPKTALSEQLARMERELTSLQAQIRSVEDTLGPDTLHLTVAKGYFAKLLGNPRVGRWLVQNRLESERIPKHRRYHLDIAGGCGDLGDIQGTGTRKRRDRRRRRTAGRMRSTQS